MNITESIAWQTVASFLRGELDHADNKTRREIARCCALLDSHAHMRLAAGQDDLPDDWYGHLYYVSTEER